MPLLILVLAFLGIYAAGVLEIRSLNSEIEIPKAKTDTLSQFHMADDCTLRSVSGHRVFFDMGSRHTFIRRDVMEQLLASGYPMELSRILLFTSDTNGKWRFYTQKVRMDIMLPNPQMPDSVFIVKNVDLIVGDEHFDNLIGMDVLKNFVIEYDFDEMDVRMYTSVPAGYHPVSDINLHVTGPGDDFSSSCRASIPLAVNDEEMRDYFFDTGGRMRDFDIVLPMSSRHLATSAITVDSVSGLFTQEHCRVNFGDRLRYCRVVFSDTLHTNRYCVNPLRMFHQDIVIDFPGRKLYTRESKK